MKKKRSTLNGIAMLFFVAGAFIVVLNKSQNAANAGWILMVIGIVKQLIEWR